MSQSAHRHTLKAAEIGARLDRSLKALQELLQSRPGAESEAVQGRLQRDLDEHRQRGWLTVAFVGQYNAGKSTMLSALTGRRDILIHSDIATGETATFDWNGVKLIDTPGIYTERLDHDAITYAALKRADLLVYCLTYSLFDDITATNFNKIAFVDGYKHKMILVVNKMSHEAGDEAQKIANYQKSIATALEPHDLNEFPHVFFDAKDYCEGVDSQDDELIEISRFPAFIEALNRFVEERGALAKLDTPIRILQGGLDEAANLLVRDGTKDNTYLELLTRLSRVVRKERDRVRSRAQTIVLRLSASVAESGVELAHSVGDGDQFNVLLPKVEADIESRCLETAEELEGLLAETQKALELEVKAVLDAPLATEFLAHFKTESLGMNASSPELAAAATARMKHQVDRLSEIGRDAALSVIGVASKKTAEGFLLKAGEVSGSKLHEGVLAVGKFFGVKFKPWQAVGLSKTMGNIANVVGPVLAIATVVLEIRAVMKESEDARKVSDARRDVMGQLTHIGHQLEEQFNRQLREAEGELFGAIEKDIDAARTEEEGEIARSNKEMAAVTQIREALKALIADISAGAPVAPVGG